MTVAEEIKKLKEEKDAVILAHYYVAPEVQDIADYIGDSYYLAKLSAGLPNKTIVFAGVYFMGESAKMLSPEKTVLMPDAKADCAMAHMLLKEEVDAVKAQYDDLATVCYINSTAEIKTWCDVSVTSANALKIVKNLPQKNILFVPDKNLGRYIQEQVPEKNIILVKGFCPIHNFMKAEELKELKAEHPEAELLVHPECPKEIVELADYAGSTSGIIDYAAKSDKKEFIIGTEIGVEHKLCRENPEKRFYFPKTVPVCKDMKTVTLEKILHVLKTGENEVFVSEEKAAKASKTLERMLELAAK